MGRTALKSLLPVGDREYADWHIIFVDGKYRHWWTPYLKEGFTHCYAVRWTPLGWLWFNQGVGYSEVDLIMSTTTNPRKLEPTATKIVRARSWRKPEMRVPQVLQAQTCVEAIKSLIGLKAFSCWTPFQLYNHLKSHNSDLFIVNEV